MSAVERPEAPAATPTLEGANGAADGPERPGWCDYGWMFDRFDIVEAHYCFAADYHGGQDSALYRRLSRILNPERIDFRPSADLCFDTLEDNGKAIYNGQEARHGFTPTAWEMSD